MKNEHRKVTSTIGLGNGIIQKWTDVEVIVRHSGGFLWKGTPDDFNTAWKMPVALPFKYFVVFATSASAGGLSVGNAFVHRAEPIRGAADIAAIEAEVSSGYDGTPAVAVMDYRLVAETDTLVEWAILSFPAFAQLIQEIDSVPNNHAWFNPENLEMARRLTSTNEIPEKTQTGAVDEIRGPSAPIPESSTSEKAAKADSVGKPAQSQNSGTV